MSVTGAAYMSTYLGQIGTVVQLNSERQRLTQRVCTARVFEGRHTRAHVYRTRLHGYLSRGSREKTTAVAWVGVGLCRWRTTQRVCTCA